MDSFFFITITIIIIIRTHTRARACTLHDPVVAVRSEGCTLLTFLLARKQNAVPGKCREAFQPYNLLFLYLFLYTR